MLYSVDSGKIIKDIPYKKEFNLWRSRITDEEYIAIQQELNRKIDTNEIHTSSWIPGSNWKGSVYEPIYEKACNRDERKAGQCFGLFLWIVMMGRPEKWAFGRYAKNNLPIDGLTYFIVDP